MPFGVTVAGDVFQCKLDECFGHIPNVIVIADDIMMVGKKPDHKDHDQALTTLLETARHCNVRLNYEKLQYKQREVEFLERLIQWMAASQLKAKYKLLLKCQHQAAKGSTIFHWYDKLSIQIFCQIIRTCVANKRACQRKSCV